MIDRRISKFLNKDIKRFNKTQRKLPQRTRCERKTYGKVNKTISKTKSSTKEKRTGQGGAVWIVKLLRDQPTKGRSQL